MSSGIVESSQSGSEKQPQQNQPISRTRLLQRLLAASGSLPNFLHELILTQAHLVAGTEAAAFLLEAAQDGKGHTLKPIAHIRPDESDAATRAAALTAFQDIMKPCIEQGKDGAILIEGTGDGSDSQFCLITLLRSEGEVVAATAVVTRARDSERAQKLLTPMQLVAGYFDVFALRRRDEQSRSIAQSHQHVLQLATAVATAEGFASAGMNLCNELAARTGAARVSLGWVKGENIKLTALSHTEEFDKKQELSVTLVKVMEECLDNDEIVQYEPDGAASETVTREAQMLSRAQGGETILSLPLRRKGDVVGVVTLEFAPNQKIGPQAATGLAVAVDLLAPQLYDRYQNDRYLITKAGMSVKGLGEKAVGKQHMLAKTVIAAVLLVALFLVFYRPNYYVKAPFQFTPIEKRTITAPFEGVLLELGVNEAGEPLDRGDRVKKDQVLLRFNTVELTKSLNKATAERDRYRNEQMKYATDPTKSAEAGMAGFAADAAQADMELLQERIDRATVKAPIDGEILVGDLKDKRGAAFKLGDPMMEVGDRLLLKAEISVAENDIQDIAVDREGLLATESMPGEHAQITIERIVPMGTAKEATNVFTVYATLDKGISEQWRPGMKGEVRILVGKRSLAWIWTHRFTDFMRMKFWTMI